MNQPAFKLRNGLRLLLVVASSFAALASSALTLPNQPLTVQSTAKPMIMLAVGRDHRLYYEAYNDASDIDGDGTLDIRFKPAIKYLGLFDSNLCYTHNDASNNTGLFSPAGPADTLGACPGKWAGNWLNYVTTSRIDALRVVLYGGMREVDTAAETVLRRAYIPQDAHSWAKEYTSTSVDGYDISQYTPLSQPSANRRHFFGNLTINKTTDCATLNNCSNLPPTLAVVTNSSVRVWEWASTERPVLDGTPAGGTRTNRAVRVAVCTSTYNNGCKQYPGGNYKPVGLLHEYGESNAALFGLISGSYDQNFSGGRLRKVMSSFQNEVATATGVYTANNTIVQTINNLRIREYNNAKTDQSYRNGWSQINRSPEQGVYPDWGNPLGEIMYEAVRYFAGKSAATPAYSTSSSIDDHIGLPRPAWDNPYASTSTAKAPWCARANLLAISDTNVSYDSDQLPGSYFGTSTTADFTGSHIINGGSTLLNVKQVADQITALEPGTAGNRFIGHSGSTFDTAPTSKFVGSLGTIRGLAPEEPTKQGSYYAASVAHYAKTHDIQPSLQGKQTIDSFFVALASPLPRIVAPITTATVVTSTGTITITKSITIIPFAKSISGTTAGITKTQGEYQPTNQIVDFYVERIANSGSGDRDSTVNGGRYEAKFRINFEDIEQGGDHDMDVIVEYTVRVKPDYTLEVVLKPIYQAGNIKHRMGYVVSGSTKDGIYLSVQDEGESDAYFLNVPAGRDPGYCNTAGTPPADCNLLPQLNELSTKTFVASSSPTASFLQDPMWYAAKYGGFVDGNTNAQPDARAEWDKDGDGIPDAYFLVQNPIKLKDALREAFNAIVERVSSSSNLATNSGRLDTDSKLFRATFTAGKWSGELKAYPALVTGNARTAAWSASEQLPAWNNRAIYLHSDTGMVDTRITSFSSLSIPTRASLVNQDTYNYLRGDKSKEMTLGGSLRTRDGLLGDFIHSSPIMDPDVKTIFVGGNGGMLHGFNSDTGAERFGYIPQHVIPQLKNLASPSYQHQYYVDGDVELGLRVAMTNDTKYVYSLLGRGGKGLVSFRSTTVSLASITPIPLWDYTPANTATAAVDPDLGYMLSSPIPVLLSNGKAGLMVGNGYNSTSGKAVLYIFMINSDGTLYAVKKLDTGVGGDNGLAGPSWIDTDDDGVADAAVAGDLKGNVWKFDISDSSPSNWTMSYSGSPMFTAIDTGGTPQPITSPILAYGNTVPGTAHYNKFYYFFGTGSYMKVGDNSDMSQQTWYGLVDDLTTNRISGGRSDLVQRSIVATGTITAATVGQERAARAYSAATDGDMVGRRGWYIDLPSGTGERMVTLQQVLLAKKPVLQASSLYPTLIDECSPSGNGYINFVDPATGGRLEFDVMDANSDGAFNAADRINSTTPVGGLQVNIGIPTKPVSLSNLPDLGLVTGTGMNLIAKAREGFGTAAKFSQTEYLRIMTRAATLRRVTSPERNPGCASKIRTELGGSEGVASIDVNACDQRLRGRVSWREILVD